MKTALLVAGGVVVFTIAGLIWLGSGPPGGVRLSNEMNKYALDYLEQHHVLAPDERVIAYYDETMKMTGDDASMVTNQNIITLKEGRKSSLPLADISEIKREQQAVIGDTYTVRSKAGESLRFTIAPLNGSDSFHEEAMAAWKRAGGNAPAPTP